MQLPRALIPVPATIWSVRNPGEDTRTFIILPPHIWGPYMTCEELQTAWDELREDGEI